MQLFRIDGGFVLSQTSSSMMALRRAFLAAIVWVIGIVPPHAFAKGGEPECLAGVCVVPPFPTDPEFVDTYGPGYVPEGSSFRCYLIAPRGPYLRFGVLKESPSLIVEVLISDTRICPHSEPPRTAFRPLSTREGLKVGDERQRVISLYGDPPRVGAASSAAELDLASGPTSAVDYGDTVLTYFGPADGGFPRTEIFLRDGRVSTILISFFP